MDADVGPLRPVQDLAEHRDRMLHKAVRLLEVGRSDLAAHELRQALVQHPEDANLHFQLARALAGTQIEEATAEARRAVELEPQWATAHWLLAAFEMDAGRHSLAEKLFLEALRLEPRCAEAFKWYGVLMYKTGRLPKAEQLLRQAIAIDPENASAHTHLGVVLSERGRRRSAQSTSQRAVELNPQGAREHALLGATYLQTGRPFRARQHLRESLRLDPEPDVEQNYLLADRCCRVVYLPKYHFSLWVKRTRVWQLFLWGLALMVLFFASLALTTKTLTVLPYLVLAWFAWCIYTWTAGILVSLWVRIQPPR
jgi:Flp pilus assembly protein TadD